MIDCTAIIDRLQHLAAPRMTPRQSRAEQGRARRRARQGREGQSRAEQGQGNSQRFKAEHEAER